ncbi:MAG: GNAT family N-acetyltransferase [Herbiconiux sp.]|nr:GNAT family N-acetyltransferase [Herbiconiux sp.]
MAGSPEIVTTQADLGDPAVAGEFARLLASYHRQTEAEKGNAGSSIAELPERYRREIEAPAEAFAAATVLIARAVPASRAASASPSRMPPVADADEDEDEDEDEATVVGCVVLAGAEPGMTGRDEATCGGHPVVEVKRLWVEPSGRGRGVATALLEAAVGVAAGRVPAPRAVRLSVWDWREPAIALYERLGFVRVPDARAWESRPGLVCFERSLP